jgi:hypothetical protein
MKKHLSHGNFSCCGCTFFNRISSRFHEISKNIPKPPYPLSTTQLKQFQNKRAKLKKASAQRSNNAYQLLSQSLYTQIDQLSAIKQLSSGGL